MSGTRLKQRYVQGDDGSRTPLGFFDSARSDNCSFGLAEDGRQRCLPQENLSYVGLFFFDSACTEKVAYQPSGCAGVKYGNETVAQCPFKTAIYSVGQQYAPASGQLFFGSGSINCTMVMASSYAGYAFYRLGAKIPAASFAAGNVMVEP